MKVLHITTDLPYMRGGKLVNYGGLGMCVLQLVEGLTDNKIDVDVLTRSEKDIESEYYRSVVRAPYIALTKSRNWKLTHGITVLPYFLKLASKNKYDIIHAHNPPAAMTVLPAAKYLGFKTVMTMHGPWSKVREKMSSLADSIERFTLDYADVVTFDSNSLCKMYGSKDNYFPIQNAVDPNIFKHSNTDIARKRFCLDSDKRVFLYSGRTVFGKNIDTIRAIAGEFPNDVFVVTGWAGNATDEEFPNIEYLKSIPNSEMPLLYSACDALILASSAEGMSRAVLEAMSCGCAVLLSDIPANSETAGKYGRYFKSEEGLKNILSDLTREEMAASGIKCRERIVREFGVSKRIERFISVYEDLSKR